MYEITGRYVDVMGYETYYEEAGSGQPVLCLAMAGASGSQYRHLMRVCAGAGFRMIAPDLPGRGKTLPDMETLRPLSDAEVYLRFIWTFVEKLALTPVVLLGTAMNATAATMLANRHPDDVKAVIACNGGVVPKAANDPLYVSMLNHPSINVSDFKEAHIPGLCGRGIPQERLNRCIWYGAKTQVADTAAADVAVFARLSYEDISRGTMPSLLLTGGDTLLQCMNCVGIKELEPVCEVEKGVVLARFTYRGCTRYVITKSGGFGHEKLLLDLADRIAAEQT